MKSMTGYGEAHVLLDGRQLGVEISSVNSKRGLDLSLGLPPELADCENEVRTLMQETVERGRVSVSARFKSAGKPNGALSVDAAALAAYRKQLAGAARKAGIKTEVSWEALLRLPGVLVEKKHEETDPEKLKKTVVKSVKEALADWQGSRMREGKRLCRDLASRFRFIEKNTGTVAGRTPAVVERHRESLKKRLEQAGLDVPLDDERLLKEIALFADRCDISEELTRLRSHLKEAAALLATEAPIGRKLDFLLQEIGREINTIGSKANDLEISRAVVAMKTELEKIREQAQNLE